MPDDANPRGRRTLDRRPAPRPGRPTSSSARGPRAPGSTPRSCSRTSWGGTGSSSTPTIEEEVAERARGRVPRPRPPAGRGVPGRLPRRPQGVLLAGADRHARRPDPPARLGVRRRRVPRAVQGRSTSPRRRRRHRLGLPRPGLRPAPQDGRRSSRSTSAPRRSSWPARNAEALGAGRSGRVPRGDLLEPVARPRALRRDPVEPAVHPQRTSSRPSSRASAATSRTSRSTAAPTASASSPA